MNTNIVRHIYKDSLDIIDDINNKKLSIDLLYEMIKDNRYAKSKIEEISHRKKFNLVKKYDKMSILDEILFLTDNRYSHLKDIRDIVNLDDLLEYMLPEKLYFDKVKIYYTNTIIDLILDKYYDYESSKLLSEAKLELLDIERSINLKIVKKIDEYYINRITI